MGDRVGGGEGLVWCGLEDLSMQWFWATLDYQLSWQAKGKGRVYFSIEL